MTAARQKGEILVTSPRRRSHARAKRVEARRAGSCKEVTFNKRAPRDNEGDLGTDVAGGGGGEGEIKAARRTIVGFSDRTAKPRANDLLRVIATRAARGIGGFVENRATRMKDKAIIADVCPPAEDSSSRAGISIAEFLPSLVIRLF